MTVTPIFFDNYAVLYKPMEEWVVQNLNWHGLQIPKLAHKVTYFIQPRGDVNGKRVVDMVISNSLGAVSLRVGT